MKSVLLYSGGLDSWLLYELYKENIDTRLYIDINGRYSYLEKQRLPKDVIVESLPLGQWERDDSIVPLRNLFFLMLASYYGNTCYIGYMQGDRSLDKTPEFVSKTSDLLSYLYKDKRFNVYSDNNEGFNIVTPIRNHTKTSLLAFYLQQGGDIEKAYNETFSCYKPNGILPCYSCKACVRKWVAFRNNGLDCYINEYYINNVVIPQLISPEITGRLYVDPNSDEFIDIKKLLNI